jgi:hypothetical protein
LLTENYSVRKSFPFCIFPPRFSRTAGRHARKEEEKEEDQVAVSALQTAGFREQKADIDDGAK